MMGQVIRAHFTGPAYGGEDFHDNARRLANAVYDGEKDAFWIAVATLMTSQDAADRAKGYAAHDARLRAMYEEPQELLPMQPALPSTAGRYIAAGVVAVVFSVGIGAFALARVMGVVW